MPQFLFSELWTITLRIWILFGLMNIQQLAIGIFPLKIQQFSCLGCFQKSAIPLNETTSCLFWFAFSTTFFIIFIFILLLPLFEYSISMVVNRQGHRELNPDLEVRNRLCYPLHYAPLRQSRQRYPESNRGPRVRNP